MRTNKPKYSLFERKRRLAARVALYGSFAFLLLVFAVAVGLVFPLYRRWDPPVWEMLDYEALPEVQLLQAYARIDTSAESGSELAGAQFLAEQLEAAGIPATIEQLGENKANLWAILEGDDPQALVLHNHIDVYSITNLEEWNFPPFGGEIELPYIYGRGVFDMKSVAIAQLTALLKLKESSERPRRSVIFLATGSEEVGSELGTRHILAHHPELAARFWAVLTEGGIVEPLDQREIKYWGIEFAQKRFATAWVCSDSRARLEELQSEIVSARKENFELSVVPEVATFLTSYAPSRHRELFQELLSSLKETILKPAEFRRLPTYIQALFRNELVAFPIEEDPEGGYRMRVIFHLLPGVDFEQARYDLLPDWQTHGLAVAVGEPLGSSEASPLDHRVYQTLHAALKAERPTARVGPYLLPWTATDSRFFRSHEIPSYGFSPFLIFATDTFRVDTVNERIGLPGYTEGVRIYGQVVEQLANDTS